MKELKSNFAKLIEEFVEQKTNLGYKFVSQARTLQEFDAYCAANFPDSVILDKELFINWLSHHRGKHPSTIETKCSPVNQFAKFCRSKGILAYSIPKGVMPKKVKYRPYIFSDEDIKRFFRSIDTSCKFSHIVPLRHLVIPVFFRILYCCGLRVSETRLLQVKDVNLERGILTLTHTKNNRMRQIPIHPDLLNRMRKFYETVHLLSMPETPFFPGRNGNPMTVGNVYRNFRRFLWNARISHSGKTPIGETGAPNVHSFRHTFAVNCLRKWMQQGKNLHAYLPVLQEYLGHVNIADTEYYLHFSADMAEDIKETLEERLGGIIPTIKTETK